MIDQLIAALNQEADLSAEEIADTLWLAMHMEQYGVDSTSRQSSNSEPNQETTEDNSNQHSQVDLADKPLTETFTTESESTEKEQKSDRAGVYNQKPDRTQKSLDIPFNVPDAPSLREQLDLARALRPLMRRIPFGSSLVLDEAATTQRIANEGIWLPVIKPTLEPWLDLELVVDEEIFMQIWRHTIKELERLLKNYGIFRDVRVWGLISNEQNKIQIRRGIGATAKNQSPRSTAELIDSSGRRLVLVVSDCVSDLWRSGAVNLALKTWANNVPTAIIQMLPQWLWGRTALGRATEVRFQGLATSVSNRQLIASTVSLWSEIDEVTGIKVPVFTLEPERVSKWAQMLVGKGSIQSSGFVFKPEIRNLEQEKPLFNFSRGKLTPEQRVQAFRVTASPMARKLAGLLASAPVISLPVVRLIRATMLKDSQQVHVAEVFLGGLLKPLSEIEVDTDPDYVQYGFIDGVRELLVDSVPTSSVLNVVESVSKFVAKKVGLSLSEFAAVLKNSEEITNSEVVEQVQPFAMVTAQVLRQLGGEYVKVADEIQPTRREKERIYWEEVREQDMSKTDRQIRILHLSDIHLGTSDQAKNYFTQLATDLTQNLKVKQLNYLVISGDIANYSTVEEYDAAFELVDKLVNRYGLNPDRVITVPGNHDLNWDLSEEAYDFVPKRKLPKSLPEGQYIDAGGAGALIRDEERYQQRFKHFSDRFYKKVYSKPYPLEYDQQAILHPCSDDKILFLALNSCWELDHNYKDRSSIKSGAIAHAVDQILTGNYDDWLKIAVWHHPVTSTESMKNVAFLEQLAVNGFQIAMHGHIHEAKDENFQCDTNRGLRIIAAGTFGAPAKEQVPGIPLQYNLLVLNPDNGELTVETRRKEKVDGAWSADARWGDKNNPTPRYVIPLEYGLRKKAEQQISQTLVNQNPFPEINPRSSADSQNQSNQSILSNVSVGGNLTVGNITQVSNSGTVSQPNPTSQNPPQQRTILVLAASPTDMPGLRLDKEIREIDEGLRLAKQRDNFKIEQRLAARTEDLRRALLQYEPQIVHFCGHGETDGIFLENDAGTKQLVPKEALTNLFKLFSNRGVQCVVLNACYSDDQAEEISEHINFVVGMSRAVGDNAAIQFAVGFYDALGAGWSYDDAYELGCNAITLEGIPEELTPVFKKAQSTKINSVNTPVQLARSHNKPFSATLSGINFLKKSDISYLLFGEPITIDQFLAGDLNTYREQYLKMEAAIHFKDQLKECDFEIGKNSFGGSYLLSKKYDFWFQGWKASEDTLLGSELGITALYLKATIPIRNPGQEVVRIVQIIPEHKRWASNKNFICSVNENGRLIERSYEIKYRCNLSIQDFPKDGVKLLPRETYDVSIMAIITTDMDNEPLFPFEKAYIELLALPELWHYSQKGIDNLTIKIDSNQGKLDELCFNLSVTKIVDVHKDKMESLKSSIFLQENVTKEFIANFSKVEALGRSKLGEYIDYLREQEDKD